MKIEVGLVREYDADKKVYLINIDRVGDVVARRLINGADKPFAPLSRVVCLRSVGVDWVILGEVEMAQKDPADARPRTVDEAVADLDSRVRAIRESTRAFDLPNFRPVGEEPQLVGDASIENRTADQRSRSRVKVFSFGSVVAFASNLCFTLWHRVDSAIISQCRSWILRTIGYEFSATLSSEDPRLVKQETVRADPLPPKDGTVRPPIVDRSTTEGYVLPSDRVYADSVDGIHKAPRVRRGVRDVRHDFLFSEVDNDRQVLRTRLDAVDYDSSGDETRRVNQMTRVVGRSGNDGASTANGLLEKWGDWLEIVVDNDQKTLRIRDTRPLGGEVEMAQTHVSLLRGDQSLRIDDSGTTIHAKNLSLISEENVIIQAVTGFIDNRTS